MKFFKKIVLFLLVASVSSSNMYAYSYAAAGKEVTIDAKETIMKAINNDDFTKAKEIFVKYDRNYKYLNDDFIDKLYDGLKTSIDKKDKNKIVYYLELSIAAEVQRRIDGRFQNIKIFNISKVMLAKANKFYKLLSVSLDKSKDKTLKMAIKNCIGAIGNPGLFGVGTRKANQEEYLKNQKVIIDIIQSL